VLISAPFARSISQKRMYPSCAAMPSGVQCSCSRAFTAAPLLMSSLPIAVNPFHATSCKAVLDVSSTVSTAAPRCINVRQLSWPSAQRSGVSPFAFRSSKGALSSTSARITSASFWSAARCSAVLSSASLAFTVAPSATNIRHVSIRPSCEAMCKGVRKCSPVASMVALWSRSIRQSSKCPARAAQ
jgi:hypothetical protein